MTPMRVLRYYWLRIVLRLSHPEPAHKRGHIHRQRNAGEVVADAVAATIGSWRFIIGQTVVVVAWITCNLLAWSLRWDPAPFILLNLLFSTQAAYTGPLVMLSQNRQASKDRMRDDHEASEVDALMTLNTQQLEILRQQSEILDALHALSQPKEAA